MFLNISMKIHILKPCFLVKHFKENIFMRSFGFIDVFCLIHALTFNIIFFERPNSKHKKANRVHLEKKDY